MKYAIGLGVAILAIMLFVYGLMGLKQYPSNGIANGAAIIGGVWFFVMGLRIMAQPEKPEETSDYVPVGARTRRARRRRRAR